MTQWGNEQYDWIQKTLNEWDADESIVWKATTQHHTLFGKHYHDYSNIVDNYLPILMQHKVDFYFNGHEHSMVYANYEFSQVEYDNEIPRKAQL